MEMCRHVKTELYYIQCNWIELNWTRMTSWPNDLRHHVMFLLPLYMEVNKNIVHFLNIFWKCTEFGNIQRFLCFSDYIITLDRTALFSHSFFCAYMLPMRPLCDRFFGFIVFCFLRRKKPIMWHFATDPMFTLRDWWICVIDKLRCANNCVGSSHGDGKSPFYDSIIIIIMMAGMAVV